ncbi:tetratricopeptide repeat protein [Anaerovorax odorimutans]|uniref:tetratricopeptide repeat protein n=1 Tax=Anaerovorax odorimutans TaxID=109327 RepID=UPI0004149B70|nr:hypothetical protein [Anaerovorax odorimutans]
MFETKNRRELTKIKENGKDSKNVFSMGFKGSDIAVEKAPVEYDIKERPDRIGKYLKKNLKNFVFDNFTEDYLKREAQIDFMKEVPIPLRKEDLEQFKGGEGLKILHIAENMAWIMGIDPHFKYTPIYVEYLKKYFKLKIVEGLVKEGRDSAEKEKYDDAAIHFRAALCVDPKNLHAMYSYARACRAMYLKSNNEEYVGTFKAEALEFFELTREIHPRFAQAYYYLGYAYLNLGLYVKAQLTWKEFLNKSKNTKDKKEIRERLEQLKEPVEIEKGYNDILAGKWDEGVRILEPFLQSRFKDWWPLSYYLGIGYISLGFREKAIDCFKHVLAIHPSHIESMDELADIYALNEDKESEKKYRKKAKLLRDGGHREKAFKKKEEVE